MNKLKTIIFLTISSIACLLSANSYANSYIDSTIIISDTNDFYNSCLLTQLSDFETGEIPHDGFCADRNEHVLEGGYNSPDVPKNNRIVLQPPEVICYFNAGNGWEQVCEKTVSVGTAVYLGAHPYIDSGVTWSWTGPNGFTANSRTPLLSNSVTLAMSGVYTVTYTDPDGQIGSTQLTLTVIGPEVICYFNAGNGWEQVCEKTVCVGTAVYLGAHPYIDSGVTWSWTGPNGFTANSRTPLLSNSVTLAMSGIYTVTYTDPDGQIGSTQLTLMVIGPEVLCYFHVGNGWEQACTKSVCEGAPVSLSAHPPVNVNTWTWTGPNDFSATGRTQNLGNITAAQDGIYTVTYTDENGCSDNAELTLNVNPNPEITSCQSYINTGPSWLIQPDCSVSACLGSTLWLRTAPANLAGTYEWTGPDGFSGSISGQGGRINISNNLAAAQSGIYTVVFTDEDGCTATSDFEVIVSPNASVFAISANCIDGNPMDDGYLQISSAEGATHYNYSMGSSYTGDANIANATAIDVNTFPLQFGTLPNPSGSEDYTVRLFNNDFGCFRDYTVSLKEQDCTIDCNCDEYIYLNEPGINSTIKFRINSDGSITELLNPTTGGHWAEGLTMSPHGLGSDINGFLYIGNAARDPVTQLALAGVDKYTCDGTLVEEDFLPPSPGDGMSGSAGAATNIYSVGNTMYMNGWRGTGYNDAVVFAYDICTRELIGTYTVCDDTDAYRESWDFHIDEANNRIIINNYQSNGIAIGDLDTHLNGPCVPIELGTSNVHRSGITLDDSGNIYVRHFNTLTKYDSNYVLQYTIDLIATGGSNAWAVVYSQSTGYLYLAGNDADCISVYDPADGSYIMQGVANPPNASPSKAVAVITECCPTNNNVTIDTTLCTEAINNTIFLQDLINCNGTICEGMWQEGADNTGVTYNSCNNSVTINTSTACGTFTLESDGTGIASQCGAFKFEVNVNVGSTPSASVHAMQPSCEDGVPQSNGYLQISKVTSGARYNWSVGSTYTGDPDFADAIDISSATFPLQFNTGLSNPSGSQDYTVRIFSDVTNCGGDCGFVDYTITMNEQDCTLGCNCDEYIYLNEPGINIVLPIRWTKKCNL